MGKLNYKPKFKEALMLKKRYIIAKTSLQIAIYILELLVISFGITYLTNCLMPISSVMEFIERLLMSYAFYQILVIVTLTSINDIQKDSCLALLTLQKFCLLYVETKDESVKYSILEKIENQLDLGTFNNNKFREKYQHLKNNLDLINKIQIEKEIIMSEHFCELATLNWRFSFILRLLK